MHRVNPLREFLTGAQEKRELVVGTRGSALAFAQTAIVCDALRQKHAAIQLHVERITTTGDVHSDGPLSQLGRGIFIKEIEAALLDRRIDIAVHSAKDLPSILAPDFKLGAILPRADARDVLISPHGTLRNLPLGARVGTSSPRRACQLRALRPDLVPVDVRGNVDTRLRKLAQGEFDALVIAAAGLIRLNRTGEVTEWLDADAFIPSVGQGALALELRADDPWALELVRPLDHAETRAAVAAERVFLAELGTGCRAAVGAHARVDPQDTQVLHLTAFIGAPDGSTVRATCAGSVTRPQALGVEVAHDLLLKGARFLVGDTSALRGKAVAITRPAERATELTTLLRAHGAFPVVCPTIAVRLLTRLAELDVFFTSSAPRWIAFTSVNAVNAIADRLALTRQALPGNTRLAAVGDATALAVEQRLRRPDFVSSRASAEALALELPDVAGGTVLFPRGDRALETLATRLSARGATVRDVIVYRTTPGPGVDELTTRAADLDAVVFTSPSSVRCAPNAIAAMRVSRRRPVVVCIGATTARAARDMGLEVVEAKHTSVGGIVEALTDAFTTREARDAESTLSSR
jgi:hydroxymethylbilane synthase